MTMITITKDNRFLIAFAFSVLLHGALLGGSYLSSRAGLLQETSDDIYAINDEIGNFIPEETAAVEEPNHVSVKNLPVNIKFVLISAAEAKDLEGKTDRVSVEIQKEQFEQKRKTIPVVKNPAVKPKLVRYTPVPYPAEAGGASGTVLVVILVGYDGRPEYASIAGSSGNRYLDAAAVEHCIDWQFTPARDANGRLVRCLVYIPIQLKK